MRVSYPSSGSNQVSLNGRIGSHLGRNRYAFLFCFFSSQSKTRVKEKWTINRGNFQLFGMQRFGVPFQTTYAVSLINHFHCCILSAVIKLRVWRGRRSVGRSDATRLCCGRTQLRRLLLFAVCQIDRRKKSPSSCRIQTEDIKTSRLEQKQSSCCYAIDFGVWQQPLRSLVPPFCYQQSNELSLRADS